MGITLATTATTEVALDNGIVFVVGYEVVAGETDYVPYQEGFAPLRHPAQGFIASVSFKGDTQNILGKLSQETIEILQEEVDFEVAQEVAQ